jgi:prolyl-tRNA editing enzyme YbaK/EbsC (Cys-tRNA(Pro) deacylase)
MGAIPPLLLKVEVKVIFDELIKEKEKVNISSGDPGAGVELSSKDLIDLIHPSIGDVVED